MRIIDVFPTKSLYKINETVEVIVQFDEMKNDKDFYIIYSLYHLDKRVYSERKNVTPDSSEMLFKIQVGNPYKKMSGYGIEVELYCGKEKLDFKATSFDVLESWKYAPRYGFLADFFTEDSGDEEDLREMNKYHINMVQFYDWMYRHHELLPGESNFTDPLGRKLSMDVVREKIDYAHKYGMKAMAYGAVYGAGEDFYRENSESGLYNYNNEPIGFGNFLYIMDISRHSKWHDHIIKEFEKAVEFGFDGIHMDQYGFPKEAIGVTNGVKAVRRLREDFPVFINDVKEYLCRNGQDIPVSFNAVNNWPVDTVAKSREDCVYIEVWPPNTTYQDLHAIISNAKRYAPEKQVVLAAYIKPYSNKSELPLEHAQNTAVMAMASIFASGGFHLLIGEKNGILNDQYFPLYRTVESGKSIDEIRRYFDFIVRYEELLYDLELVNNSMVCTGGLNEEYTFSGGSFSPKAEANSVWTIVNEKPGFKIINLVNFTGINDMEWNSPKSKRPDEVENIEVKIAISEEVEGVYAASPDFDPRSRGLEFKYIESDGGGAISFTVPKLKIWDLVYVVFKPGDTY